MNSDIRTHNRIVWDKQVELGNPWTIPVSAEEVAAARAGDWRIYLTPTKPIPKDWFPPLQGCDVLCLASGGGQQGPIMAAVGANVTVLDNSPRQLDQDRRVAERDGLDITTVEGDMRDLSMFRDASFDLIIHPVANVYIPDARPVWHEAFRVLRPGGSLLAGVDNPVRHSFDYDLMRTQGILQVKYIIPCAKMEEFTADDLARYQQAGEFLEFSHTLDEQIGGQIDVGFLLGGFYEDIDREQDKDLVSDYMPVYIATRALKPAR